MKQWTLIFLNNETNEKQTRSSHCYTTYSNSNNTNFSFKMRTETATIPLTLEALKEMKPGTIFACGEIENSPEGIYMTDVHKGSMLKWVAKRGGIEDWAISTFKGGASSKKILALLCTVAEFVEIEAKHDFYFESYKEEEEILLAAFVRTHDLYNFEAAAKDVSEMSEKEREKERRISQMSEAVKEREFQKQLNQ